MKSESSKNLAIERSLTVVSAGATLWLVTLFVTVLARSFGLLQRYGLGNPEVSLSSRIWLRLIADSKDSFEFTWKILLFMTLPLLMIRRDQKWPLLVVWILIPTTIIYLIIGGYVIDGHYNLLFMAPVGLVSGLLHPLLHLYGGRMISFLKSTRILEG